MHPRAETDLILGFFQTELSNTGWMIGQDPLHQELGRCGWYAWYSIDPPRFQIILEPYRWDGFHASYDKKPSYELELYYEYPDGVPTRFLMYSFDVATHKQTWPKALKRFKAMKAFIEQAG